MMNTLEISKSFKNLTKVTKGHFEFLEVVGVGGFGKVWKVRFEKSNHILAIKEMSKALIIKKNMIKEIFHERDILCSLYSPFIINIYCTFQDQNNIYVVMDYIPCKDFRYYLQQSKGTKYSENQIKFVCANIAMGLDYIHSNGVIHSDIKPENLLLEERGYLRITDFGVSVKTTWDSHIKLITGTPGYIPPECVKGKKCMASDYFALGIILYEMITGHRPLESGERDEKYLKNNDLYNFYDIIRVNKDRDLVSAGIGASPLSVKSRYDTGDSSNKLLSGGNENSRHEENNINCKYSYELEPSKCKYSSDLCDLVNRLICMDPKIRLGANGFNDIKNHHVFDKYEWKHLYHKTLPSPIIPIVKERPKRHISCELSEYIRKKPKKPTNYENCIDSSYNNNFNKGTNINNNYSHYKNSSFEQEDTIPEEYQKHFLNYSFINKFKVNMGNSFYSEKLKITAKDKDKLRTLMQAQKGKLAVNKVGRIRLLSTGDVDENKFNKNEKDAKVVVINKIDTNKAMEAFKIVATRKIMNNNLPNYVGNRKCTSNLSSNANLMNNINIDYRNFSTKKSCDHIHERDKIMKNKTSVGFFQPGSPIKGSQNLMGGLFRGKAGTTNKADKYRKLFMKASHSSINLNLFGNISFSDFKEGGGLHKNVAPFRLSSKNKIECFDSNGGSIVKNKNEFNNKSLVFDE